MVCIPDRRAPDVGCGSDGDTHQCVGARKVRKLRVADGRQAGSTWHAQTSSLCPRCSRRFLFSRCRRPRERDRPPRASGLLSARRARLPSLSGSLAAPVCEAAVAAAAAVAVAAAAAAGISMPRSCSSSAAAFPAMLESSNDPHSAVRPSRVAAKCLGPPEATTSASTRCNVCRAASSSASACTAAASVAAAVFFASSAAVRTQRDFSSRSCNESTAD